MSPTPEQIARLRDEVAGPVFLRGEDGLAVEVSPFNTAFQPDPEVVVGVTSESDVVAAVRFAAESGLVVRVQATGHGAIASIADGVLITTSRLAGVEVDPQTGVATVDAGARWSAVLAAGASHGLAPIAGASSNVGAIGFALGGGLGPLSRSHGFGSDWVRGFRIVLASGEAVTADADTNPELFWALRGGKAGFGVVTQMRVQLAALAEIYGGSIAVDAEHTERLLRAWVDWTATAPDTDTSSIAIMRIPDIDGPPPPLRGRTAVALRFASVAEAGAAEASFAPLRAVAPPILGAVGPLPTTALDSIHGDPTNPGPAWVAARMLSSIDQDFATALLELAGPAVDVPFVSVELRHLGGATTTDVPGGSAVGGRSGAFTFTLVGAPVPQLFETVAPAAAQAIFDRLQPWLGELTTINFAETTTELSTSWPPEILDRLAAVRAEVDPHTMFPFSPLLS